MDKLSLDFIQDKIRGSLIAGAAGDALGYPVEFMPRQQILNKYGSQGITQLEIDSEGKALVSDDTQLTLFTAAGLLNGITRWAKRGMGPKPDHYVSFAYLDWYYTQGGQKADIKYTWLRDLPQLAYRRAPGITCLTSCEALLHGREVYNDSKGCGGIMRVAPIGLLMATKNADITPYSDTDAMQAGAEIARCTHRHPLGFLPAALLTRLVQHMVLLRSLNSTQFMHYVYECLQMLKKVYPGEFEQDKKYLTDLTERALKLAADTSLPDHKAIAQLGEGWVGEEAWAIAVYCVARHIEEPAQAIIAAVNHNGDSDSTGGIAGNIVGALYGLRALEEQHFLCPEGCTLVDTVELADIILALADDLSTDCIITEFSQIDTPKKQQWYKRYCEMEPAGLEGKAPVAYRRSFTPGKISSLKPGEIFVFGSNLAGSHGGGAAYAAWKYFGAVMGQGVGLQGQSYAIPTMQGGVETIKPYVDEFIAFARSHPELTFWVTRIGCGIAGFTDDDIAPLFRDALPLENVLLPQSFVKILDAL